MTAISRPVALGFVNSPSDSLPARRARGVTYERRNDLAVACAPWILATDSDRTRRVQSWVRGLALPPFLRAPWLATRRRA